MMRYHVAPSSAMTSTELPSSSTETPLDTLASRKDPDAHIGLRTAPGRNGAKPSLRVVIIRSGKKVEDGVRGFHFATAGKYQPLNDRFVTFVIDRAILPPNRYMNMAAFFKENPHYSMSQAIFSSTIRQLPPTAPATVRCRAASVEGGL